MRYIVSGREMKLLDNTTSKKYNVPPVVLMEQAAIGVVQELVVSFPKKKNFLIVCGKGNNGGDGIAIARLLNQKGYKAYIHYASKNDNNASELFLLQKSIYEKYGYPVIDTLDENDEYDVVIDAVFGVGLSRKIEGEYAGIIRKMNNISGVKIAIDISSGICSDTGRVLGVAFKADISYTFSYEKIGQILWPGYDYSGTVKIVTIGINNDSFDGMKPRVGSLEYSDLDKLPLRSSHSNKGTYGKLVVVAGSKNMAGAAILCAKAAYRCGTGLVKIVSPEENRTIIQNSVPEALFSTYDNLEEALDWADAIVIGPGIGRGKEAVNVLKLVLEQARGPLIIDADALNIISDDLSFISQDHMDIVVTPHLGEMSRLTGKSITQIQNELIETAVEFANKYNVVCVLKDFKSIIADSYGMTYINQSGNNGMATAGSGDVLSGIIGSFLATGLEPKLAASMGAFVHGMAADLIFNKTGTYGMMASDIIEGLNEIWNKVNKDGIR